MYISYTTICMYVLCILQSWSGLLHTVVHCRRQTGTVAYSIYSITAVCVYVWCVCMCGVCVCVVCVCLYCQIAAEVQSHTTGYKKGDIPSYKLYLHLGDILKLSANIPQEYVTCVLDCVKFH